MNGSLFFEIVCGKEKVMNIPMWCYSLFLMLLVFLSAGHGQTAVQPGDTLTKENLTQAEELLTPATRWMVERGMPMSVIATKKVQWPKAYQEATEKYAAQVQ